MSDIVTEHGVAQEYGHLTTEQLSTFLDEEGSAEERARWDAHLKTCQRCQQELAGLRQTVVLLRTLPQPVLPRSFVLSADVVEAAVTTAEAVPIPISRTERRRQQIPYLRVAFRTLSGIAAVIGIVFFLSGVLSTVATGSTTTGSASSVAAPANSTSSGMAPVAPPTGTPPQAYHSNNTNNTNTNQQNTSTTIPVSTSWPTILFFNLSTSEGRLGFGIILFILGVMGYILFRRQRRHVP